MYANECVTTTAKEPDVDVAANRLSAAVERLQETVARLSDRLIPVCGPEPKIGAECAAALGSCAVSQAMYTSADRVDGVNRRIRDLLDRLEI